MKKLCIVLIFLVSCAPSKIVTRLPANIYDSQDQIDEIERLYALNELTETEVEQGKKFRKECLEIKEYVVGDEMQLDCNTFYHHFRHNDYNDIYDESFALRKGKVRIAGFNVYHPGMDKTKFKDYFLMSKIMNSFDLVAATELISAVSDDYRNNQKVIDFIDEKIKDGNEREARRGYSLYRAPGYYVLLKELRKRDKSWSLLLAPRGQAAKRSDVHELAGFYYRASMVRPQINPYCRKYKTNFKGNPFGCIPNFNERFLGVDARKAFSRKPFMADFVSGNFDFTILTSHVVYNSPRSDSTDQKVSDITKPAFGVNGYKEIEMKGVNGSNYARVAEVKLTLDFISKLKRSYRERDLIFVGDLNLTSDLKVWDELLGSWPGSTVLNTAPTTITKLRYRNGAPTEGKASDYDHFIVDSSLTSECSKFDHDYLNDGYVETYSFFKEIVGKDIMEKFIVRGDTKNEDGIYSSYRNRSQISEAVDEYREELLKVKTIERGEIVVDDAELDKDLSDLKERIYESQTSDKTFYQIYQEKLSDHFPIFMHCRNDGDDDDSRN